MGRSPPSSSVLLMAGSALLVAAAAVSQWKKNGSSTSSEMAITKRNGSSSSSKDVFITDDEVCKIFDRLFMDMQSFMANLTQQIRQIQMSGQATLGDAQITGILVGEFERFLKAKQTAVFDEFDVDADCLEEAVWEFLDEPERHANVVKSVERFQKLYETFSGESVVGWRPGKVIQEPDVLDADATVQAAEAYFGALTTAMKDLVESFHADGRDLTNPVVAQELSNKFASVANTKGEEALSHVDVTLKTFQASVEHHSSNPTVARALTMLQIKHQQDVMTMGVPDM